MLCFFQYVLLPPFAWPLDGRRGQQREGSTFFEIRGMDADFSLGKACGGLEFVGLITSYWRSSSRM